jgi:hypothetical protein
MLEVAVICVLQLLDKAREKYELPKLWLDHKEFLLDEHRRMDRNIRLDQWVSALLCVAITNDCGFEERIGCFGFGSLESGKGGASR